MKTFLGFIFAIPDLVRLIKAIQKFNEEQENKTKVRDDIKKIDEAFRNNDASKLNSVFASKEK